MVKVIKEKFVVIGKEGSTFAQKQKDLPRGNGLSDWNA